MRNDTNLTQRNNIILKYVYVARLRGVFEVEKRLEKRLLSVFPLLLIGGSKQDHNPSRRRLLCNTTRCRRGEIWIFCWTLSYARLHYCRFLLCLSFYYNSRCYENGDGVKSWIFAVGRVYFLRGLWFFEKIALERI